MLFFMLAFDACESHGSRVNLNDNDFDSRSLNKRINPFNASYNPELNIEYNNFLLSFQAIKLAIYSLFSDLCLLLMFKRV